MLELQVGDEVGELFINSFASSIFQFVQEEISPEVRILDAVEEEKVPRCSD